MNKKTLAPVFAVFALAAPFAMAQPDVPPPPGAVVERNWAVSLGLGVSEFTGGEADAATDIGLGYDVRVAYGLPWTVSVEGAILGGSQTINALGLDEDAKLKSLGLETIARLGLDTLFAPTAGPVLLSPFLFGGLAYMRYSLNDEGTNTSVVAGDDNVLAIPFGAGVGGMWGNIIMDARFTYRAAFDEDLFRDTEGENADTSLSSWTLGLHGGLAF